jgi:fatty-acyl-CoA synthase
VSPPAPATVVDLVRARASDATTGVLAGDQRWAWDEVVARSEATARLLTSLRSPGPFHVGILMDNSPDYLFTLFGAALAGATSVGINNTRRGEQLAIDILHTDCQLVLCDGENAGLLDGLDLGTIDVHRASGPEWSEKVDGLVGQGAVDGAVQPGDLFTLIFTSGSTGAPKAVRMTHGRAAELATAWSSVGPDDVAYCAIPLFHTNALMSMALPALNSGGAIALRGRFSASQFMPDIRSFGATFFSTAGRALSYILGTAPDPEDRNHKVKFALAAEASPRDIKEFRRRFGIQCFGGYSSSENAITMVPVPGMPKDALGVPREGIDAAVVNPVTSQECARAIFESGGRLLNAEVAIGEIVGRNVVDRFEGYYNNPEANAERTRGGWYWSGDLGYRDDDGIFYFAGRTGEWLRVDAENFAAAPVERILARYPDARAVAVFAVPDERTADDQVMAAVEMAEGVVFDPSVFADFLAAQPDLGTKWAPRYIRITMLPVGATNKIDKNVLRRERWNTDDPVYWRAARAIGYRLFTDEDRAQLEERFTENLRSSSRP